MSLAKEKKLEELYHYFLEKGFTISTDKISEALGITKRTIFNRYRTLENLEKEIMYFWRISFKKRFEEKSQYCNNEVEKLLYFIYELKISQYREADFYKKEFESKAFLHHHDDSFVHIVEKILEEGVSNGYFRTGINMEVYSRYLLFNLVYLFIPELPNGGIVYYLLIPILTEEGHDVIKTINITEFLN